jgi:hypothetical protein
MMAVLLRSSHPAKEHLIKMLDVFETGRAQDLFLGWLVARPALLTLAYAVAIAVQGASWWWLPVAFLGGVGAFFACSVWSWTEQYANLPKPKRWLWLFGIQFAELTVFVCWIAVWIRMVLVGGLYGLYLSVPQLNGYGMLAAVLSIVLGYFFSKYFNALFFFVLGYTSLRKFRPSVPSPASA